MTVMEMNVWLPIQDEVPDLWLVIRCPSWSHPISLTFYHSLPCILHAVHAEPMKSSWCLIFLSLQVLILLFLFALGCLDNYYPSQWITRIMSYVHLSIPAIQLDKPFLVLLPTFGSFELLSLKPFSLYLSHPWSLLWCQICNMLAAQGWFLDCENLAFPLPFLNTFSLSHRPHSDNWTSPVPLA